MDKAGFVGLERCAALPRLSLGMRYDGGLDRCCSLFLVRPYHPGVKVVDKPDRPPLAVNRPFDQVGVVEHVYSSGDSGDPCGIPAYSISATSDSYLPTVTEACRPVQKSPIHSTIGFGTLPAANRRSSTFECTPLKAPFTSKEINVRILPPLHA
jgi:hypothetical protein